MKIDVSDEMIATLNKAGRVDKQRTFGFAGVFIWAKDDRMDTAEEIRVAIETIIQLARFENGGQ